LIILFQQISENMIFLIQYLKMRVEMTRPVRVSVPIDH
jgi:hypothetical protein